MPETTVNADTKSLFEQLESLEDPRLCVAKIREEMARYKQAGLSVPDDLVRSERRFQTECMLQSQGR